MLTFITSALVFAATAQSVSVASRDVSASFRLHVYANPNLSGWAIVNAHAAAVTNVLEVQRPSVYTSDIAYLSGSASAFNNGEAKLTFALDSTCGEYEMVVPSTPRGVVSQVTTQLGVGSAIFNLNSENIVSRLGNGVGGFWACPTNIAGLEVLTLFFGVDVPSQNLPSSDCQSIQLQAAF